jgi:TetR/AcrR family transcriptional regulator
MSWKEPLKARQQIAAEKRGAIIREAARAFNRRGYHGTNLDEVAERLGITKPALYYYIKDKEALLLACHEAAIELAMDAVARADHQGGGADERLGNVLRHYVRGLTDDLRGSVVLMEEGALGPANLRRLKRQRDTYESTLRGIVRDGMAEGVFVPCDEKIAVFVILGAVNWISKWYAAEGPRGSEELAEMISAQFIRGLSAGPTGRALLPEFALTSEAV